MIVLAATTQVVQADTDVATKQLSYPWWSAAAIVFYPLAAACQVLLIAGIVGLRRRGVTGSSRWGGIGLAGALVGSVLILIGDLATVPFRNDRIDGGWPLVIEYTFAAGTVLMAIGFLLAGRAALQAGVWRDWRGYVPLAMGLSSVVLIGAPFTGVFPVAIGIFSACFLALGVALSSAGRSAPAPHASAQRA